MFEGCLLQRMARADAELLVGTHWDAQFGAMLTFGFGGTLVELQRDTALLPATASRPAIARALSALRQYPLLNGYRGRPPARVDSIVELIHRMGQLAAHGRTHGGMRGQSGHGPRRHDHGSGRTRRLEGGAMSTVTYERCGHLALITLRRSERRNAINAEMTALLHEAGGASPAATSALPCSAPTATISAPGWMCRTPPKEAWKGVPNVGVKLDKPLISAVSGWAVGAGFTLTMMSDLCVVDETAQFLFPKPGWACSAASPPAWWRASRTRSPWNS